MFTFDKFEDLLIYLEIIFVLLFLAFNNNLEIDNRLIGISIFIFMILLFYKLFHDDSNLKIITINMNNQTRLKELFGENYIHLTDKEKMNKWTSYFQDITFKYGEQCIFNLSGESSNNLFIQFLMLFQQWGYIVEINKFDKDGILYWNLITGHSTKFDIKYL